MRYSLEASLDSVDAESSLGIGLRYAYELPFRIDPPVGEVNRRAVANVSLRCHDWRCIDCTRDFAGGDASAGCYSLKVAVSQLSPIRDGLLRKDRQRLGAVWRQ